MASMAIQPLTGMWLRLGVVLVLWLAVFHVGIRDMVGVWMNSNTYQHGFLILPISLWLCWQKKDLLAQSTPSVAYFPVLLLLGPLSLWLVGRVADISLFMHAASVFSLIFLIWAVVGNQIARIISFPLFYLIFCIPFGEMFVPALQNITADFVVAFLRFVGIPVYREALFIAVPNGLFEVAEACSGIRFLIASVALGCLFSYLSFASLKKRLLFIGFSFIFPIIANGFRATLIVLIGYWSDMTVATGADHLIYGWVFFSLVIGLIFAVANRFADSEIPAVLPAVPASKPAWMVVIAVTVLMSAAAWWTGRVTHNLVYPDIQAATLPQNVSPAGDSRSPVKRWGITFAGTSQQLLGESRENGAWYFRAVYPDSNAGGIEEESTGNVGELISASNKLYDPEHWTLDYASDIELAGASGNPVMGRRLLLADSSGNRLAVIYLYCVDDYCGASGAKIKLWDALSRLSGSVPVGQVFAVAVLVNGDGSEDESEQLAGRYWIWPDQASLQAVRGVPLANARGAKVSHNAALNAGGQ